MHLINSNTNADLPLPYVPQPRAGEVWLVGAGPGDPSLITVQGLRVLQRADVVVHDRLGCEELMQFLPPRAKRIDVGKIPDRPSVEQEQINRILEVEARAGNAVVRLKGGDPFVLGRGMEELLHLHSKGIPVRVVPGVTSAVAGPAAAGIPVTHRAVARGFSVSTGRTREGAAPAVSMTDTRIFLMGMTAMHEIVGGLLREGFAPGTPAAVVSSATTYRQQVVRATLGEIVEASRKAGLTPPGLLIVGETVALAAPPIGALETIVVTSNRVPMILEERRPDARFLWRPLTRIEQLSGAEANDVRERVSSALAADWIVFNSRPAVGEFLRLLNRFGIDARAIRGRIAAVGADTAMALEEARLISDVVAVDGEQQGLMGILTPEIAGASVAVPCSSGYGGRLSAGLRECGAGSVVEVPVYHNTPNQPPPVDWKFARAVFFASPSAAGRFVEAFPEAPRESMTALCVGESAALKAAEAGFERIEDLTAEASATAKIRCSETG